jgi:hypothetical protein
MMMEWTKVTPIEVKRGEERSFQLGMLLSSPPLSSFLFYGVTSLLSSPLLCSLLWG